MRKKSFIGVVIVVLGLLIAIGPFSLFHVCRPDDPEMYMRCYWTARSELGIGLVIGILGLLTAILPSGKTAIGLNFGALLNGIVAFLIPNFLIGVCEGEHMHCHAVSLPALSILSVILVVVAIINIVYIYKKEENKK
ncbi:MAG: DUF4418 family protein [Clostridia bacterium]|nr:DUF4418 family protein [Clostridia bacterium]